MSYGGQYPPPQGPPPNAYNQGYGAPPQGYGAPPHNNAPYGQQPYGDPAFNNNNNYGVPPTSGAYTHQGYANIPDGPSGPKPPTQMEYGGGGEKPTFEQAFQVQRPKWNDLWAGILFILVFLGFAAVSGIAIAAYVKAPGHNGGSKASTPNLGLTTETIYLFVYVLALAFVLSWVYLMLARMFTKQFIWITGILNIAFGVATCAYMLYRKQYVGGIIFGVFVIFLIIAFISWIPRIPFSALMLKTAIDVAKNYGHVFIVSAVGGLIATLFAAWYAVTLVAVYVKWAPTGNASWATVGGIIFFITFAGYWITEWLKNTIHTTICGVYGAWYFNINNYPSNATRGALRRSLTYSFGSISLGSLIVALINLLKTIIDAAGRQAASEGDILGMVMACFAGCLVSMLQWVAEFVNRYAFAHIALYGKAYFQAAKDTWKMIKDRGIDALVNECLVGPVLSFGCLFVGYACALLAYVYLILAKPDFNTKGDFTGVILAFAFLIGLQICAVFTTPLSSGIDAIFVAAAWDPEVMMRDHPALYHSMVQVYPQVQEAIHA
ncbi:DUF580-domain-containing protein [Thozetella sp. PMI_491]|nr:DUF580-domain-containing protein [Thozetella sp. PMI_491]